MSYILDALRKADAERRGVPAPQGLTEPAVLVTADPDADLPPSPTRPWAWVLGGVAVALAASVAWHVWRDSPDAATQAGGPLPTQPGQMPPNQMPPPPREGQGPDLAPMPPPQGAPRDGMPPPGPVSANPNGNGNATASVDTLPNFPPPLPEAPKPEPARASVPPAGAGQGGRQPLPPGIAMVAPPAPATPAADRVYTVDELPEAVRRDMPRLAVGGAMYSQRVADRMVILNGQVFHEGDTLGKDLKLRQIKLKTAVLEFRGYRVEIGY